MNYRITVLKLALGAINTTQHREDATSPTEGGFAFGAVSLMQNNELNNLRHATSLVKIIGKRMG